MNGAVLSSLITRLRPYEPEKVVLFGSAARGGAHDDSDLDLAIIKDTDQPFYQRVRDVRKLLRSRNPLDVFVFTPQEYEDAKKTNAFVAEIDRTGKVLYEHETR